MSKTKAQIEKEKNLFGSDDDSEDDEDYVPPEDKDNPAGAVNAAAGDQSSEEVTGVEAIKRQKR